MTRVFADTFYSFTVMSDEGLTDALTGDHHFEQAGFAALLRDTTG
jgi:predicted nucleic acid-binding protein